MDVQKTLKPNDPGTRRYVREYGDRLVCVRYRRDPRTGKRFTTVELIVDERYDLRGYYPGERLPGPAPRGDCLVRIEFHENDLRTLAKAAGGRWDPSLKLWRVPAAEIAGLGLQDRVMDTT